MMANETDLVVLDKSNEICKKSKTPLHMDNIALEIKIRNTKQTLNNMALPELLARSFQPLHIATYWNLQKDLEVLLMDEISDINVGDNLGATPLHIAAVQESNEDMLQYLLEHGSDIFAKNKDGWNPFHYAVRYADAANVKFLMNVIITQGFTKPYEIETNAGLNALHLAAANPKIDVIQYIWSMICNDNANIDQLKSIDKFGFTPVHRASKHGHTNILKFLFTEGFETQPVNKDGFTPLHISAKYGHLTTVEYLLSNGLSKHSKTKNGHTPFNLAKKHRQHPKLIEILRHPNNVNIQQRKVTFIPESDDDEEDEEENENTSFEKNMFGEMAQPFYEVLELGFPILDHSEIHYWFLDYINSEAMVILEEEDIRDREKELLMKAMYSLFIFAGGPIHSVETDILTYLGFYLVKRQLESIKQDEK